MSLMGYDGIFWVFEVANIDFFDDTMEVGQGTYESHPLFVWGEESSIIQLWIIMTQGNENQYPGVDLQSDDLSSKHEDFMLVNI